MAKTKGSKKKPRSAFKIHTTKSPQIQQFLDPMQLKPSWRIARLELMDPYGWHVLDRNTLQAIRERLRQLESLTWHEILIRDNYQNHEIETSSICSRAQQRLREIGQDDRDHIVSLRLGNMERVWGFRDNEVLNLLWWDPNHEVYG